MRRTYFVFAATEKGFHTWHSTCDGFSLFGRVQVGLIEQWREYSNEVTGMKSTIIGWKRVSSRTTT